MKSGLYTWIVGSANETGDKWKFIASTGDVAKGDVLVEGESQIYSAQAYQLLSKAAGPKNKPATQEQLRQELDANTALISKVATWTKAGLAASYAHKQDDSQKLDWKVRTVSYSAGYSVNTMTGTVQPRVDCEDPSEAKTHYDIADTEPKFIDHSGDIMEPGSSLCHVSTSSPRMMPSIRCSEEVRILTTLTPWTPSIPGSSESQRMSRSDWTRRSRRISPPRVVSTPIPSTTMRASSAGRTTPQQLPPHTSGRRAAAVRSAHAATASMATLVWRPASPPSASGVRAMPQPPDAGRLSQLVAATVLEKVSCSRSVSRAHVQDHAGH